MKEPIIKRTWKHNLKEDLENEKITNAIIEKSEELNNLTLNELTIEEKANLLSGSHRLVGHKAGCARVCLFAGEPDGQVKPETAVFGRQLRIVPHGGLNGQRTRRLCACLVAIH